MNGMIKTGPRRRFLSRSALAALGATALTVALAGQVSAAAAVSSQTTFAGYTATPSGGIASASATFKVPTISCADDNPYLQEFGIDIDNAQYSTVLTSCDGAGNATYEFNLRTNGGGSFTGPGVSPGDTMLASIWQTISTVETRLTDETTGVFWYDTASPSGGLSSASIGGVNLGDTPPFTKVAFSKCQVNALYLGYEGPTQYNQTSGSTTLVTASRLGSPGDSFKLTYKHEI
jgi:hypothetical protein